MAQLVMVDQVLVAQAQAEHPLTHQGAHVMHHPRRIATIHKAAGEAIQQAYGLVGGRQQHRARVRSQPAAVKSAHNFTPAGLSQIQRIWDTLLGHRGTPANGHLFVAEKLSLILSPYATRSGEKSGLGRRGASISSSAQERSEDASLCVAIALLISRRCKTDICVSSGRAKIGAESLLPRAYVRS